MKPILERLEAMVGSTREVPGLRGVRGTYRFDVEGVGSWRAEVDDGVVKFTRSDAEADCAVASSAEDLERIATGSQNLLTAAMQGRVEIRGDLALAQKLHGLLPGPGSATPTPTKEPRR